MESLHLLRTDSQNEDFRALVVLLDRDLAIRDGADHAFFAQFNGIARLQHVVVAYLDGVAVGCGAFKPFAEGGVEVKRMYVQPAQRGQGIALHVLRALEAWALEEGHHRCVLETGLKQPEAIRLYEKADYTRIPNFPPYTDVTTSVCMERLI